MKDVSCEDLGVADCDFVARGENARGVVEEMTTHLEEEHGIGLPDTDAIMKTYPDQQSLLDRLAEFFSGEPSKETQLVVQRLRGELDIGTEEPSHPRR